MTGKNIFFTITLLVALLVVTSCNDEKEDAFEALADVYYVNKMENGEMLHAIYFYAYGSAVINSATVTIPGGEEITLNESFNDGTTLAEEPDSADFTTELPEEGNYVFDVESKKGEMLQVTEMLEVDSLAIPSFTKTDYSNSTFGYSIEWNDVEGADAYLIRIINEDGETIYNSYTISGDTNEYEILQETSGYWDESPLTNETYMLQILAYSFDDDANVSNYVYNVQQISIGETTIIWGE